MHFRKASLILFIFIFAINCKSQNTIENIPSRKFYDIKSFQSWKISSIPSKQPNLFPEANFVNNLSSGFNRAKLVGFTIDPLFLRNNSSTPEHIKGNPDLQSNHFVREIMEQELYPYEDNSSQIQNYIYTLNLSYYPKEKGSYNYDVDSSQFSFGIDTAGQLLKPETRWAGIMKPLHIKNFEEENIQNIEFWLMDPFINDLANSVGELYFNFGDISEDVLLDNCFSNEVGYNDTNTVWGEVSNVTNTYYNFYNLQNLTTYNDCGLDGKPDVSERNSFNYYLNKIKNNFGDQSSAYLTAYNDPSNDNYHYCRGTDYDEKEFGILERYKNYNLSEGNSVKKNDEDYSTIGTVVPDFEDVNYNRILETSENYFQYLIYINPDSFVVGNNFIDNKITSNITFENGNHSSVDWFHFKIPITSYKNIVGEIENFKNIEFVRLFLKNFKNTIHFRFASLELTTEVSDKYIVPKQIETGRMYVYPNPNNGTFRIYHESDMLYRISDIKLYDTFGYEIPIEIINEFDYSDNSNLSYVQIKGLKDGIYILSYIIGGEKSRHFSKIVIKN